MRSQSVQALRSEARPRHRGGVQLLAWAIALAGAGCGGGSNGPSSPSTTTDSPLVLRISITAAGGLSPAELIVAPGSRVIFTNNHSQQHEMTSDPHPEHTDCTPLNSVGLLRPGESRESGNLVTVRTCGFHDHANPSNTSLQGRIVVR